MIWISRNLIELFNIKIFNTDKTKYKKIYKAMSSLL